MAKTTMPALESVRTDALTNPKINTRGDRTPIYCPSKAVAFEVIFRTVALIQPLYAEYIRTHKTDKLRTAEPLDAWVERMIYTHTVARDYTDYDVCAIPCLDNATVELLVKKRRTA